MIELEGLPASRNVSRGLRDLRDGEITADALMVAVASRRLADLGLPIPSRERLPRDPELTLYELLCSYSQDPFTAYRAILGELDSFVSCLEALRASTRAAEEP